MYFKKEIHLSVLRKSKLNEKTGLGNSPKVIEQHGAFLRNKHVQTPLYQHASILPLGWAAGQRGAGQQLSHGMLFSLKHDSGNIFCWVARCFYLLLIFECRSVME